MATITTFYIGALRTEAKHNKSGVTIITDAPEDNQGRGESFSPTDLLACSLGSCMLTIIGIEARNQGFDIDGTRVEIIKRMTSDPRKVSALHVSLFFPKVLYSDEEKELIKQCALTCPVALSLHPDINQQVEFHFYKP